MFSELGLPPVLAEAIAARGYEEAMPVQVAVMEESNRDRDLLVSSQTGSGKTLAFGALLARVLLVDDPAQAGEGGDTKAGKHARAQRKAKPTAGLVIAPTRELANQVCAELTWLFARAPVRIAAFTGGSDIRRDLKLLSAGVDLVVGTPGRLVDLLTRGVLQLEAVEAVVLDEADEMLDMGFREDLETLLAGATARKRTHMFSATLPRPILALAAHYQKDAVRVDARKLGGQGTGSHEDICYVAHLIAMGDRMPAVINVLRQHADERAIVFGTTRDGVADLHRAVVREGFRAVVLSGDRAQSDRNRALQSLRDGEAQVLVATNVAARGLDLPEVDLVVHADLPLNVEALTHRSGRTGRAGRKGTSVVIANLAERRKAERLLANARVQCTWTAAPSAAEIAEQGLARLESALVDEASAKAEPAPAAIAAAERLGKDIKKDALILMLLGRELARVPKGEKLKPVDLKIVSQDRFRPVGPAPDRTEFSRDAVVFRVNLGAQSHAEPGWLLPLICRRGGVTRREVGAIRVGPGYSEFEISGEAAKDFAFAASQPDPRAPHVHIEASERSSAGNREQRRPAQSRNFTPPPAPRRSSRPHDSSALPPRPPAFGGDEAARRPSRPDDSSARPPRAPAFGGDEAPRRPSRPHDSSARPPRPLDVGGQEAPRRPSRPLDLGGHAAPRRSGRPLDFGGHEAPRRTPRPSPPPWKATKGPHKPAFGKKRFG
jgi:ATP-dependent RNA helicase DeaD